MCSFSLSVFDSNRFALICLTFMPIFYKRINSVCIWRKRPLLRPPIWPFTPSNNDVLHHIFANKRLGTSTLNQILFNTENQIHTSSSLNRDAAKNLQLRPSEVEDNQRWWKWTTEEPSREPPRTLQTQGGRCLRQYRSLNP